MTAPHLRMALIQQRFYRARAVKWVRLTGSRMSRCNEIYEMSCIHEYDTFPDDDGRGLLSLPKTRQFYEPLCGRP
jgi:hypothetical protein